MFTVFFSFFSKYDYNRILSVLIDFAINWPGKVYEIFENNQYYKDNIFDKLRNKKALIIIDDTFRMAVDIIKLPK